MNTIFFLSSAADVKYFLQEYENVKSKNGCVYVYISNSENILKFIKSLNLNLVKLKNINNGFMFSYRNLLAVLFTKRYLYNFWLREFKDTKNARVIFFSRFFDWQTHYFISRLTDNNTIEVFSHYDSIDKDVMNVISIPIIFKILILKYITGITFHFTKQHGYHKVIFPLEKYSISVKDVERKSTKIIDRYSYKPLIRDKAVLLFESDIRKVGYFSNYREDMSKVLELLKNYDYSIYIKPHPRLGYSDFLKDYEVKIIPSYIPGEFIDISTFSILLGIETVVIAYFARNYSIKCGSLLRLFSFTDCSIRQRFEKYLKQQSDNKIRFINNIKDLDALIKMRDRINKE